MLNGLLFQTLIATATLLACLAAGFAALRRDSRAGFRLLLAGAFAFVFYLSLPRVVPEMLAAAMLAIVAGALLMPPRESNDEPIDFDSTATRRLRK